MLQDMVRPRLGAPALLQVDICARGWVRGWDVLDPGDTGWGGDTRAIQEPQKASDVMSRERGPIGAYKSIPCNLEYYHQHSCP